MSEEEKIKRIEKIKQTIFDIEIGSDFLSSEQHAHISALYTELRELQKEVKGDS